jgi:acyl-CoA thioester hydrolase
MTTVDSKEVGPAETFGLEIDPRFSHRLVLPVRFADLDPNNHVNNAVFVSLFEAGRVSIIRSPSIGLMPQGFHWTVARVAVDFRSEVRWPGDVTLATGIQKIGRTSLVFEQILYFDGKIAAQAETVNVFMSKENMRPAEIFADLRVKLEPFLLREA